MMSIRENFFRIRREIPSCVTLVVAAKQRSVREIEEVIDAGATDIGENYVQEAEKMFGSLGEKAKRVQWHMIGDLQANKINKALRIFDRIQTVGSWNQAEAIDKRVKLAGKDAVQICIEINSGNEASKSGLAPDLFLIEELVRRISKLESVRLEGLMTLGPLGADPGLCRPYFRRTKEIFDQMNALGIPGVRMRTLSMGMSDSYRVAIEEGATMVRVGRSIFGERSREAR